jgi:hypothetical protein
MMGIRLKLLRPPSDFQEIGFKMSLPFKPAQSLRLVRL